MSKSKKNEFRPDDFVVYPAHGVGRIVSIEEQEVAGLRLEMFVISFDKDKMTLRVPTARASEIGMRSLSTPDLIDRALETLKGKARVKRTMWSRRAQEYEAKINSGALPFLFLPFPFPFLSVLFLFSFPCLAFLGSPVFPLRAPPIFPSLSSLAFPLSAIPLSFPFLDP